MKFQKMKREGDIRKLEMKLRDERTDKAAIKDELFHLKSKCTILENDIENRDNVITRLEKEIGRVYLQVEVKDNQIHDLIGNRTNSLALPQSSIMQQDSQGTKKPLKIFLASSIELKDERNAFELHFGARKRKNFACDLEVVLWEDFIDAMSPTRLQEEYNKAIKGCDIFVMLFFSKVGIYTQEEFEKAFGTFKENGKPLIYTYFKEANINSANINRRDTNSLWDFKDKLKELGHFVTPYKDENDLNFQFSNQLDKLLKDGKI
jgi:internalin A